MTVNPDDIREVIEKARGFSEVKAEDLAIAEEIVAKPETLAVAENLAQEPKAVATTEVAKVPMPAARLGEDSSNIRNQIAEMTMPEKIKLALFGNSICRGLLILDPNRMIQQFVLKNPKLTPAEVEVFARNPQMAEGVIRTIADSRTWMKSASLKYVVVTNPKTPGDIALKWMRYIPIADLRKIAKSKNLSQLIAVTAKKRVAEIDEK